MNAFVVLGSVLATASAGLVAPYAGLQYGPAPYAAGVQYANAGIQYGPAPYAAGYGVAPVIAAPVVAAPAVQIPTSVSSQFQAQDEFGNVNYGYSNINSAKQEVGNAYGGVTGSYQYIDANNVPQRVDYIADDLGFRVKATNLPVAPIAPVVAPLVGPSPVVYTGVAPTPVDDTPEVAAAKAEFFAAFEEAKSRTARSVPVVAAAPLAATTYGLPLNGALAYNGIYNGAYNGALGYNGIYNGALGYTNGLGYNGLGYNGYATGYGYANASPLNYGIAAAPAALNYAAVAPAALNYAAPVATVASAPAAREAVLTTIKLNPGHATAYRVDK